MLKQLIHRAFLLSMLAAPLAPAQVDKPAATGEQDVGTGSPVKLQALSPLQVDRQQTHGTRP